MANYGLPEECCYDDVVERPLPPEVTVYCAGPPCQSFSDAGQRGGVDDERGQLFEQAALAVLGAKPHAFVIENVVP
eukprot:5143083-Alexandrium_andersonii.AAC.1